MQYTIYTDGNYSRIYDEGAFAFIILKGNEEIMRKAVLVKCETNNRAELKAIIAGVYSLPDDATEVRVISDSMYALKTLSGDWKRLKNQDLFYNWEKRVKAMRPNLCIEFMFVKGHSGDYYNELCDQLCVERLGYNPREGKKEKKEK